MRGGSSVVLLCSVLAAGCSAPSRKPPGETPGDARPAEVAPAADALASAPPCYAVAPPGGIYTHEELGLQVAVVDGCVSLQSRDGDSLAELAGAGDQDVELPTLEPRVAMHERNRLVLRATADGLTVIRFGRFHADSPPPPQPIDPRLPLAVPVAAADEPAIAALLVHRERVVQAAAVVRLMRQQTATACDQLNRWMERAVADERQHAPVQHLLIQARSRCLLPSVRVALRHDPSAVVAARALERLGTAAERAAGILELVERHGQQTAQAIGETPDQVSAIFAPLLARSDCPAEQDLAAMVLSARLQGSEAPEAAWKLLADHLAARPRATTLRDQVTGNLTGHGGCVP